MEPHHEPSPGPFTGPEKRKPEPFVICPNCGNRLQGLAHRGAVVECEACTFVGHVVGGRPGHDTGDVERCHVCKVAVGEQHEGYCSVSPGRMESRHDVPTDVLQALAEVERYRADNTLMAQHNADLVREVTVTREALQRIFYWSAGKPGIETVWTIARDALAGVGSASTEAREDELFAAKSSIASFMREVDRLATQLADADNVIEALHKALQRHPEWCGYNLEAPGDSSYNEALDIYAESIRPADTEEKDAR